MKTLLIRGSNVPPRELRAIVERGSTEVCEVSVASEAPPDVDRVVVWDGREVAFDDRHLRWPEDREELRMLFDTGG